MRRAVPPVVLVATFACSDGKVDKAPSAPTPSGVKAPETPASAGTPAASSSTPPPASSPVAARDIAPAELASLVGRPLSETVSKLGLDEASFDYTDEPPAKLKMIRLERDQTFLEIHLQYEPELLFSDRRKWPLAKIGAATVIGFVHTRGNDRRVVGVIHEALTLP